MKMFAPLSPIVASVSEPSLTESSRPVVSRFSLISTSSSTALTVLISRHSDSSAARYSMQRCLKCATLEDFLPADFHYTHTASFGRFIFVKNVASQVRKRGHSCNCQTLTALLMHLQCFMELGVSLCCD